MARPLAECGTWSAYKRHKARGEPVDDACAQAAREQNQKQRKSERAERSQVVQLAVVETPAPVEVDELEDAKENLELVKAAMKSATPRELAALSKRREELVRRIATMTNASKKQAEGGGLLDQLAARRSQRLAGTAH